MGKTHGGHCDGMGHVGVLVVTSEGELIAGKVVVLAAHGYGSKKY